MRNNLFLSLLVILALSGCSVLDVLQTDHKPVTCVINEPNLPSVNEDGNVVLYPEDQANLLIYIESMENCIDKLQ